MFFMRATNRAHSAIFNFFLGMTLILFFFSCGERTRIDSSGSGDDQSSLGDQPKFEFLSGNINYDKNSGLLILSSWIYDKLAKKDLRYEYIIDLSTDQFLFLKNQSVSTEGEFNCVRKNQGLCVELEVTFPGLETKVSARLGQMEIEQVETGIKTSSTLFSSIWPPTPWKNNNLPWIHFIETVANPIGTFEAPNYNTEDFLILPGSLNYQKDFYSSECKTNPLTSVNFEVNCEFREKMSNLITAKKWLIQFSF
jgi:hypothetical protein